MKILIVFLLSVAALFGQTCSQLLSTQSLTFNEPHYGPMAPSQLITVNLSLGPTSWSRIAPFGTYAIFTDTSNGHTNSTSTSVYLYLTGTVYFQPIANGYTDVATIQFNPGAITCTINITYNIVKNSDPGNRFTNNLGIADTSLTGCTSTGGRVKGCDLISTSTIGSLPGGSDQRPANGSTVTTTEWGTKIKRCSPNGYVHVYSSINALNSDNSVISATPLTGGGLALIDTATCTAHAISGLGSNAMILWDWAWAGHVPQNNRAWTFRNNTIIQLMFSFTTWTITSNTVVYRFTGAGNIGNGGTDDINDQGYIAFNSNTDHSGSASHPNLCAIQIGVWTAICVDLSIAYPDAVGNLPNYVLISKGFDSRTNEAYLLANTQTGGCGSISFCYGPRYSFHAGDTSLTFEDYFGIGPEATLSGIGSPWPAGTPCTQTLRRQGICIYTGSHSHTAEDSTGRQYWVTATSLELPFAISEMILDMEVGSGLDTVSKYLGGGIDIGLATAAPAVSIPWSGETGCIRDWCAITGITETQTSWKITNVTASGGNSTITLDSAPGSALATGTSVVIGNVGGCTQLNSSTGWPGSSVTVSSATVTITGTGNCPSSYVSNTGVLAKNAYPSTFSYRQEVLLLHVLNGSTIETRRIGNTYSQDYSDTYTEAGAYWTNVGATLSHDLSLVVVNSNGGKPDEDAILLMSTGIATGGPSARPSR